MSDTEPDNPAATDGADTAPEAPRKPSMSRLSEVLFASGTIGNGLLPGFLVSWQMVYFAPPSDSTRPLLVAATVIGWVNLIGQIVHSLADWAIGYLSDRTRTRWGRRIPWIVISSPIYTVAFVVLWWPPATVLGWQNVVWLAGIRAIMWIAYTASVGPYCSLLPEVTEPGEERTRVGGFMAVFEVLGTVLSTLVAGHMIDAHKDGGTLFGWHLTDGFKYTAAVLSLVSLVSMWISIAVIREKPHSAAKEVPYGPVQSLVTTLQNPAFAWYALAFIAFRIGLNAIITVMPYQTEVILHLDDPDSAAGNLQGVIVLGSIPFFLVINSLVKRVGKRRVMLWGFLGFAVVISAGALIGKLPFGSPVMQAYLIYALSAFPVATLFMLPRPIMADIIDLDAERTGYRREGIYNGAEGLLTKFAEGMGPFVAAQLLDHLGRSSANPLGVILTAPISGGICLLGWLLFLKYPIHD